MFCWNCGSKNPDENRFCGECGKSLLLPEFGATKRNSKNAPPRKDGDAPGLDRNSKASEQVLTEFEAQPTTGGELASSDANPARPVRPKLSNPLVEEPRLAHTDPIELLPQVPEANLGKTAAAANPVVTEPRVVRETLRPSSTRTSVERSPRASTNRITGPSFLGLSDEPQFGGDSSYLLEDSDESSSWRGYLALAFLFILGVLIVRQWTDVRGIATDYAQRLGITDAPRPVKAKATVSSAAEPSAQTPATGGSTTTNAANSNASTAADKPKDAASNSNTIASMSKPENDATSEEPSPKPAETKPENETAPPDETTPAKGTPTDSKSTAKATSKTVEAPAATYNNAQVDLAQRYLQGKGVAQDCNRGVGLLRSAAREPNPKARIQMAALYASGHCVQQDQAQAYIWFAKAQELEPHNTWIERNLNLLWAKMSDEERKRVLR